MVDRIVIRHTSALGIKLDLLFHAVIAIARNTAMIGPCSADSVPPLVCMAVTRVWYASSVRIRVRIRVILVCG